ncbi:MAG: hypothetical protein RMX68_022490 [Aulosira sp. ZfuVER01]|nr:hypothetical protein [Aulosira sp. ZfuVER01]MDZ7998162.1 hypothetical protein [Aulosira sp. DedVER01a]MDZ8051086.1 hypothetical protein [Aulosira sp. ZfuCHP01]
MLKTTSNLLLVGYISSSVLLMNELAAQAFASPALSDNTSKTLLAQATTFSPKTVQTSETGKDGNSWVGTWVRVGKSKTYKATWRSSKNEVIQGIVKLEDVNGDQVIFSYRGQTEGIYEAKLSPDQQSMTGTWSSNDNVWYGNVSATFSF